MIYDYNDMQIFVSKLMADKETDDVEFKSAKGGFPKSFWETYSAFANSHGGIIVLGVKEKDNIYTLNNLTSDEANKLQKDFWNGVHNKSVINTCLLKNDDVKVAKIKGSTVVLFYIPKAQRDQRPIHCSQDAFSGTFRRNFEGDYLCSNAEVRRMYADADIMRPADGRILKHYTWDDIDLPSVEQYRRMFSTSKPSHPWHSLNNEDLMRKLGGFRKDKETGDEGFTLAGILMFGKYESIIDPSCAPRFFPDYKEIPDETFTTRWIDRICPDGTWEANLFQFYRRVLPKLHQVVPTPFQLDGNQRRDETPAHEAIREAFANLCVHADYSEDSSLIVNKCPHKIVFSNPGTMLISKRQYYQGGESVCRNTSLQQMFMMIGSVEKAGSGVDKIMKGWKALNWKRPYAIEKVQPNKVELIMPLESLIDNNILYELEKIFGDKIKDKRQEEVVALSMALTEGIINNERLRDVLTVHTIDITHLLQKLCKEGFLIPSGYGRGTVYRIKDATSEQKDATSEQKDATSEQKDATSEQKDATVFPSKISKEDMFEIIKKYCSEWRSISEIAAYVGRSKPYIRNRVIHEMQDILQKLFPKENHPGQKYKVKQ